MHIPYDLSIDSFRVERNEFRIVFERAAGGYFTLEFQDGIYYRQGVSNEQGKIK